MRHTLFLFLGQGNPQKGGNSVQLSGEIFDQILVKNNCAVQFLEVVEPVFQELPPEERVLHLWMCDSEKNQDIL